MALISCKECGNQISSQAPICPRCGAPTGARIAPVAVQAPQKKMGCLSIIGLVFLSFIIIGVIKGASKEGGSNSFSSTPSLGAPLYTVTAKEIVASYKANEVAADQKYKDQVVQVTGTIESIGKDILDSPYVTLGTGDEFEFRKVQCTPDSDNKIAQNQLAGLSPKQKLTVKGRVKGLMGNILLEDCVLP